MGARGKVRWCKKLEIEGSKCKMFGIGLVTSKQEIYIYIVAYRRMLESLVSGLDLKEDFRKQGQGDF